MTGPTESETVICQEKSVYWQSLAEDSFLLLLALFLFGSASRRERERKQIPGDHTIEQKQLRLRLILDLGARGCADWTSLNQSGT